MDRNVIKGGISAPYLEPDRDIDVEEDITAIKSSVRSRVGGGRGGRSYESEESSEEEEAHERLMRAKDGREDAPVSESKRQTRESSNRGGCGSYHMILLQAVYK